MVRGIDRYDDKERRKVRRTNHFAKDLRSPLFRQRVSEGKRPEDEPPTIEEGLEEQEWEYDDEDEQ